MAARNEAKRAEIVRLRAEDGLTRAAIAERLNTSDGQVGRVLKRAGTPARPRDTPVFPPALRDELYRLSDLGVSNAEIGLRLDRTPRQVRDALHRREILREPAEPPRPGWPKMLPCLGHCGKPRLTHAPGLRRCDDCKAKDEGAGCGDEFCFTGSVGGGGIVGRRNMPRD